VFQGRQQQLVLAAEVEADDTRGQVRRLGDTRDSGFGQAVLGDHAQGGVDELPPPLRVGLGPRDVGGMAMGFHGIDRTECLFK